MIGTRSVRSAWTQAWQVPRYRSVGIITLLMLAVVAFTLPYYFEWVGGRASMRPYEPFLDHLPAVDLSLPIFFVLYGCIAFALGVGLGRPWVVLRTLQAFVLMLLFRMVCMGLWPLLPPSELVPLVDPLTGHFYPGGVPFTMDLFFSGHTATMCLLLSLAWERWQRTVLVAATVVLGGMLLVQHVHWTMDVVAAPFFAWAAWKCSGPLQVLTGADATRSGN